MSSLTPHERNAEAANAATMEGLTNAALTLIPTSALLFLGMKNPNFVKRTNWQSRTAMTIMPPLFVFGFTAEHKLSHKMHEIAQESRHSSDTVKWAEEQMKNQKGQREDFGHAAQALHLSSLYQQSVEESGVCIVPGDSLSLHHKMANYAAENPIKVLAGAAVPAVGAILFGNQSKQHLEFSVALLHTRVFGQFTTLALLLGVMGFKEFMDKNGKFITQAEADARVEEMHRVRSALMSRLHHEREAQLAMKAEIEEAHQEDLRDAAAAKKNKKMSMDATMKA